MAKKHHRFLSALLAAMLLSSSAVSVSAATVGAADSGAGSLAKYYSTNGTGVGKEASIKIDGDASDWNESMKIAQGAAWDMANHWKGGHENCVLDTYALYAAWDDSNLYIGWQMVNTTDTWARSGDGPLSDGGRVLDVPLIIALSTDPNATAMTGKTTDGKGIWGVNIEFDTHVDTLLYMSGKPGLGTPGFFKAADSSGAVNYTDTNSCQTFKDTGVEYALATTNINSEIWGLDGSEDPMDVCDDSAQWIDYATTSHDTTFDSFYEAKIPFSALGITKSQLTQNGIGAMVVASRGESGLDCVPFDLCMIDNATGDYSSDPSTSAEKDDKDIITVSLASVGNGTITPPPAKTDTDTTTKPDTDTTTKPDTDTTSKPDTDTTIAISNKETVISTECGKGDEITVTLGVKDLANALGVSNTLKFDTTKFTFKSAKALYDGVEFNSANAAKGEIKWNGNFGDGTKGVNMTSDTALLEVKFTSLGNAEGNFITNYINDIYNYDMVTVDSASVTGKAVISQEVDTEKPVGEMDRKPRVTANEGDVIDVTFCADLDWAEGIKESFTYDPSLFEYTGFTSLGVDGVNVEANKQKDGVVLWNMINSGSIAHSGSMTDVMVMHFKARKNVSNALMGTIRTLDSYDKDGNIVVPMGCVNDKVSVQGTASSDTDVPTPVEGEVRKISVAAKKGDRVIVTFKANGVKSAAGIQEVVDFDKSALSYNGDVASSFGVIDADASNGRVAWNVLFDNAGTDLTNAEVAVMSFTALKDIKTRDSVLSFSVEDFYSTADKTFDLVSTTSAAAAVRARGEGSIPVTAKKGDYVTIYCSAIDAQKALGIVEEVSYDNAALKYLGCGEAMGHFDMQKEVGSIRWSIMFDAKGTNLTASTNLVSFSFIASKDITSSDVVASYKVEEFYDTLLNDYDVSNTTMAYSVTTKTEAPNVDKASDADKLDTDISTPPVVDTDKNSDTTSTDTHTNPKDTDTGVDVKDSDKDNGGSSGNTKTVTILFGDVDNDTAVTASDAVIVLRTSADMATLEAEAAKAADVNEDSAIDAGDALSVLRFSVNLKDSSRAGQKVQITFTFN